MAGFLLKDFLYLKQQGKILIFLLVFYTAFFIFSPTEGLLSVLTALAVMMSAASVINTFAYDEAAKWDRFAFSLPVTRKQAVYSRYLFTLILSLAVAVFALIVAAAAGRGVLTAEDWVAVYATFGVSLVLCSVLIPLVYRFGLQKARIVMVILFMIPFLLAVLAQKLNLSGSMPGDAQVFLWLKLSPLVLTAIFAASVLLSCGIMEKKEV